MRHVRILGLCLIASFAVVAIAATSASALPEFGQCFEQPEHLGKYTNSVCTAKAKVNKTTGKAEGQFEWRKESEVSKKNFEGSAGAGVLEGNYILCEKEGSTDTEAGRKESCPPGDERKPFSEKPLKVECTSEANHGVFTGAKTIGNVSVTFRGCTLEGTSPCSNTSNEGEIHVNTLKGQIGYINKKTNPRQVGLQLEPAVKKGEFAKFDCLSGQIGTIVGEGNEKEGCAYPLKACGGDGIISTIGPVNTTTSELTQVFTVNEETQENIPNKFEGKPLRVLESYIFNEEEPGFTSQWSKAGETITNVAKGEVEGEIKAN